MRRRRSSKLGKELPARSFGIASSRSPAWVVTVFSGWPLRQVVRVSVRSPHSAPIFVMASASISSCSSLSAISRTSSRPSAERSDSSTRSRSYWDKVTVHPLGPNWPFTPDSCTVACHLSREQTPADGAPPGSGTRALNRGDPLHHTAGRHRRPSVRNCSSPTRYSSVNSLSPPPPRQSCARGALPVRACPGRSLANRVGRMGTACESCGRSTPRPPTARTWEQGSVTRQRHWTSGAVRCPRGLSAGPAALRGDK